MNRQLLPPISQVTTETLADLRSQHSVVVVAYITSEDKVSHEAFLSVANAMHSNYVFGISNDASLAQQEVVNVPRIAVYKDFDEQMDFLPLPADSQDISAFIKDTSSRLVADFYPETHQKYVDVSFPLT